MNMESPLKIKGLLLLALLLIGCSGPSALITDRGGAQLLVEDLESDGEPLLFRRDGVVTQIELKKIALLEISAGVIEIYGGDTWQFTTLTFQDDEKKTNYTGWLTSGSVLTGECPGGPCELSVPTLNQIDFVMEEVPTTPADSSADSSATTETTPAGE
jgi:hypothetical protein